MNNEISNEIFKCVCNKAIFRTTDSIMKFHYKRATPTFEFFKRLYLYLKKIV